MLAVRRTVRGEPHVFNPSFSGKNLFLYTEDDAARIGMLFAEQLESAPLP